MQFINIKYNDDYNYIKNILINIHILNAIQPKAISNTTLNFKSQ
jgi:hypothetical protein